MQKTLNPVYRLYTNAANSEVRPEKYYEENNSTRTEIKNPTKKQQFVRCVPTKDKM